MRQTIQVAAACLVVLVATAGQLRAGVINFDSDDAGYKANGFTSDDSLIVHFSDSIIGPYSADGLEVQDFGDQSHGRALAVNPDDDASKLIIDFDSSMNFLSLWFGNDDPGWTEPGDYAQLTLFNSGTQVGQTSVVFNRDDIMNQAITYSGNSFNQATFEYVVSGAVLPGLIEIVDDIEFEYRTTPAVPEPFSFAIWGGLGAVGLVTSRVRRRREG